MSPLRFGLGFLLAFALLTGGFEACRGTAFERAVVEDAILAPTVRLINALTPAERAALAGRVIITPDGATLRVVRGCEGVELLLMLAAALIAFPASAARRLLGLLLGSLLAWLLAIGRLAGLYYTLRFSPEAWEALHGLVLPLIPVALLGLFFLRWSAGVPLRHAA